MTPKPDHARFLERLEASQLKHDFLTNDLVNISWHQPPRINGRPLKLGIHGLTVLLLLAQRALETPGDYIPTEDIVFALEKGRRLLGDLHLSWDHPTKDAVHAAASNVRLALKRKKLSDAIVECVMGKGYRLSTPAMNIVINVPGSDRLARLLIDTFVRRKGDKPPDFRRRFPSP